MFHYEKIIYFSTTALNQDIISHNPYLLHKNIEEILSHKKYHNKTSQVIGFNQNQNNLIYLYNSARQGKHFF